MKKVISLFLALFFALICALSVVALNIPEPTSNLFVNDFADVMTSDDKLKIQKQGEALYKETNAQIVVATVNSLFGADIETYANEMFRSWQLGDKNENNGVLLLLSVNDRKVRIEVGYGLEGALNDSKCGRILRDYGNTYFSDNEFSKGLVSVYDVLISETCNEYGIENLADSEYYLHGSSSDDDILEIDEVDVEIFIIIMVVIIVFIANLKRRLRRMRMGGSFFDPDDNSTGHYGGGFFGGGGFSGGGGSSGGGGASSGF